MRLLTFPEDVAIGGLEAQADRLANDAAIAAAEAEALVRSLLRGDRAWRAETRPVQVDNAHRSGPRAVA